MTFLTFSNTEGLLVSKQTLSVIVHILTELRTNHSVIWLKNELAIFLSSREIKYFQNESISFDGFFELCRNLFLPKHNLVVSLFLTAKTLYKYFVRSRSLKLEVVEK